MRNYYDPLGETLNYPGFQSSEPSGDRLMNGDFLANNEQMPLYARNEGQPKVTHSNKISSDGNKLDTIKVHDQNNTTHKTSTNAKGIKTQETTSTLDPQQLLQQASAKLAGDGSNDPFDVTKMLGNIGSGIMEIGGNIGSGIMDRGGEALEAFNQSGQPGGVLRGLGEIDLSPFQRLLSWGIGDDIGGAADASKSALLKSRMLDIAKKEHDRKTGYQKTGPFDKLLLNQLMREKREGDKLTRKHKMLRSKQSVRAFGYLHKGDYEIDKGELKRLKRLPGQVHNVLTLLQQMDTIINRNPKLSGFSASEDRGRYLGLQHKLMQAIGQMGGFGALQAAEFAFLKKLTGETPNTLSSVWQEYFQQSMATRKGKFMALMGTTMRELDSEMSAYDYYKNEDIWGSRYGGFAIKPEAKRQAPAKIKPKPRPKPKKRMKMNDVIRSIFSD